MSYALRALAGERRDSKGSWRTASVPMLVLLVAIGIATAAVTFVAALGAALAWWPTTPRVAWAPPVLLVATIRSVLYVVTAVAEWRIWLHRRRGPVGAALALFVAQQMLATLWPILFFAGYTALGTADLWVTVVLLLVLDLLLVATTAAFWRVSTPAGAVMALDLVMVLFVTALILGSAGEHAVL